MEIPPGLLKFLKMIGVNTTRLQWRLRNWEELHGIKKEFRLPTSLRWLQYKHKFCTKCEMLLHRDETECSRCGAPAPSVPVYRALRALGLLTENNLTPVTVIFATVCTAVFLLTLPAQGLSAIMHPTGELLIAFGSWTPQLHAAGEYWRLLAFGVMHIGLLHFGFNMYSFSILGPMIESEINPRRMFVLITVTQLTAALGTVLYYQNNPTALTAGASGWLFGLIGFGITYFHRQGIHWHHYRNAYLNWAIYSFAFGFFLRANNAAHLSGALGGAAMGMIADLTQARIRWGGRVWEALFWPCLALWCGSGWFLVRSIISSF